MKPIDFEQANTKFAEDQPYITLPALRLNDDEGTTLFCWRLTLTERVRLLFTGKIWHWVLTFDKPLQPQMLVAENPFGRTQEPEDRVG